MSTQKRILDKLLAEGRISQADYDRQVGKTLVQPIEVLEEKIAKAKKLDIVFRKYTGLGTSEIFSAAKHSLRSTLFSGLATGVGVGASLVFGDPNRDGSPNWTHALGAGALTWGSYEGYKMITNPEDSGKGIFGRILNKQVLGRFNMSPKTAGLAGAVLAGSLFATKAYYGASEAFSDSRGQDSEEAGLVAGTAFGVIGSAGGYKVGRALSAAIAIGLPK